MRRRRRPRTRQGHRVYRATPTFSEFASGHVRSRANDIPASISRVRDTVAAAARVFGDIPVARIEPLHIERFRTCRLQTVAPGTVKRELAVLHAVYLHSVDLSDAAEKLAEFNGRERDSSE